jgi:hypothetical protein
MPVAVFDGMPLQEDRPDAGLIIKKGTENEVTSLGRRGKEARSSRKIADHRRRHRIALEALGDDLSPGVGLNGPPA